MGSTFASGEKGDQPEMPGHAAGQPAEQLPLFVFGTLRRGKSNHHYLQLRYDRALHARLPDYAIVESLMIDRVPGKSVTGELFFLTAARYQETLDGCDDLEGIAPGSLRGEWYERRRVTVEADHRQWTAWAYVRPEASELG